MDQSSGATRPDPAATRSHSQGGPHSSPESAASVRPGLESSGGAMVQASHNHPNASAPNLAQMGADGSQGGGRSKFQIIAEKKKIGSESDEDLDQSSARNSISEEPFTVVGELAENPRGTAPVPINKGLLATMPSAPPNTPNVGAPISDLDQKSGPVFPTTPLTPSNSQEIPTVSNKKSRFEVVIVPTTKRFGRWDCQDFSDGQQCLDSQKSEFRDPMIILDKKDYGSGNSSKASSLHVILPNSEHPGAPDPTVIATLAAIEKSSSSGDQHKSLDIPSSLTPTASPLPSKETIQASLVTIDLSSTRSSPNPSISHSTTIAQDDKIAPKQPPAPVSQAPRTVNSPASSASTSTLPSATGAGSTSPSGQSVPQKLPVPTSSAPQLNRGTESAASISEARTSTPPNVVVQLPTPISPSSTRFNETSIASAAGSEPHQPHTAPDGGQHAGSSGPSRNAPTNPGRTSQLSSLLASTAAAAQFNSQSAASGSFSTSFTTPLAITTSSLAPYNLQQLEAGVTGVTFSLGPHGGASPSVAHHVSAAAGGDRTHGSSTSLLENLLPQPGCIPPAGSPQINDSFIGAAIAEGSLGGTGPNVVAIDNKIEQAMDLVKTHLMYAVREEVEVLRAKITDLEKKVVRLEKENTLLREHASPEVLAQLVSISAPVVSSSPSAGTASNLNLHGGVGAVPPMANSGNSGNPLVGVLAGARSPSDPVGTTLPPTQQQQQQQ